MRLIFRISWRSNCFNLTNVSSVKWKIIAFISQHFLDTLICTSHKWLSTFQVKLVALLSPLTNLQQKAFINGWRQILYCSRTINYRFHLTEFYNHQTFWRSHAFYSCIFRTISERYCFSNSSQSWIQKKTTFYVGKTIIRFLYLLEATKIVDINFPNQNRKIFSSEKLKFLSYFPSYQLKEFIKKKRKKVNKICPKNLSELAPP